jgi:hypothetical protein
VEPQHRVYDLYPYRHSGVMSRTLLIVKYNLTLACSVLMSVAIMLYGRVRSWWRSFPGLVNHSLSRSHAARSSLPGWLSFLNLNNSYTALLLRVDLYDMGYVSPASACRPCRLCSVTHCVHSLRYFTPLGCGAIPSGTSFAWYLCFWYLASCTSLRYLVYNLVNTQ